LTECEKRFQQMETGDHNQGESDNIYINQLGAALEGFMLLSHDPLINRGMYNKGHSET